MPSAQAPLKQRPRIGRRAALGALTALGAAAYWLVARELGAERPISLAAIPPPPKSPTGPRALAVRARSHGAPSGSAFAAATKTLTGYAREDAILNEVLTGNVPEFLRELVPLRMGGRLGAGQAPKAIEALLWVLPDYVAIGNNEDFLRVPMMATTAQKIADELVCTLPTRAIVDAVYAQAAVKLDPLALETNADMVTTDAYLLHQKKIEEQRRARGAALGALTAGHKKDIVLSAQMTTRPDRVAIYGMHSGGEPIQPLSLLHELAYVDYAHGVRLVYCDVLVGHDERRVIDVLGNPSLASVLSDEGVLSQTRYSDPPGVARVPMNL